MDLSRDFFQDGKQTIVLCRLCAWRKLVHINHLPLVVVGTAVVVAERFGPARAVGCELVGNNRPFVCLGLNNICFGGESFTNDKDFKKYYRKKMHTSRL